MSDCQFWTTLLTQISSPGGLQNWLNQILTDIKQILFPRALFGNPSLDLTYNQMYAGAVVGTVVIPASQRIAEVPEPDILQFYPAAKPGGELRGVTVYESGKILLNPGYWCLETLIHETLHSVSIFSQRKDLGVTYRPLIEGLTECLTGYLLFRRYQYPYENCVNSADRPCKYTYAYETRVWCSFCHVIGISETYPMYFWDGNTAWEKLFQGFVDRIHQLDYPTFANILTSHSKLPAMTQLHQQCGINFKDAYGNAYRSLEGRLDFSGVKP